MPDPQIGTATGPLPEAETTAPDTPEKGYTAVVYVHGMGSQRRYEETSRLVDAIDRHLYRAYHGDGQSLGILRKIVPRSEPHRDVPGGAITFIRASLIPPKARHEEPATTVRFYEAYWAPVMAGAKSPWGVLKWIVKQASRPLRTLRVPWRDHHRLHRAGLADLRDRAPDRPGVEPGDWQKLLRHYAKFDELGAKRDWSDGSFADFQDFVRKAEEKNPETTQRLIQLSQDWHRHYVRTEMKNGLFLTSILLALLLVGGGLLVAVQSGLAWAGAFAGTFGADSVFGQLLGRYLEPGAASALAVLGLGAAALGLTRFLTDYMGDVEAWATYEETDEKHKARAEVIRTCAGVMAHVLTDARCTRVVVVAHSLGTSIAHDSLLALRQRNQIGSADNPMDGEIPLGKISHFITMASPVDKINYFFETFRSASHRYVRVVEALRGDIVSEPFSRNLKPWVHWINFWDEADVISGPLHSPTGRVSLLSHVDNVHVPRLFFPNPGAAHVAYFENRRVIGTLFDVIYGNRHSYQELPSVPGKGKDYPSVRLGPGQPRGRYRAIFVTALSIPWIATAALIASFAGAQTAAYGLGAIALGLTVALGLGGIVGAFRPGDDPL